MEEAGHEKEVPPRGRAAVGGRRMTVDPGRRLHNREKQVHEVLPFVTSEALLPVILSKLLGKILRGRGTRLTRQSSSRTMSRQRDGEWQLDKHTPRKYTKGGAN